MKLERLGSFHQSRLSFMRILLRRLRRENWVFERPVWEIDAKGVGHAVYTARGPRRTYSLVAFSHDLDPAKRSDRVIAEEWDATFTVFDGVPNTSDLERLARNVPKQEAGRIGETELSLSRANRSARLFDYVVASLAGGAQPDATELDKVGYLMRTTAVYGSGKFGALDWRFISNRPEFRAPYQVEMLSVYLTRAFTLDIADHLAQCAAPGRAVSLAPALRRRLGVGNSTGLGMAPFLANHPKLFNNWIAARERALARVRSIENADAECIDAFKSFLARQATLVAEWKTSDARQSARVSGLASDLERLGAHLAATDWVAASRPFDELYQWGEKHLTVEGQECLVSLLLEPFGDLVDDLSDTMSADEQADFLIDGAMRLGALRRLLSGNYGFALAFDFTNPKDDARFWYVSEEKLEPRLGERHEEPGADRESPLAIARDVALLARSIDSVPDSQTVAEFLLRQPEHRHAIRRVQTSAGCPYCEIRDNLTSSAMMPIDLLRCKLSFFGATNFDPRSDRWVRINMYQHAPLPNELAEMDADAWVYPAPGRE